MGIGHIPIPSNTGISRIHLFGVFWSSKTGIWQVFFFGQVNVWVTPLPFLYDYFLTFICSYVLLFVLTNLQMCVHTVLWFEHLFVCAYKWMVSLSLSLSLSYFIHYLASLASDNDEKRWRRSVVEELIVERSDLNNQRDRWIWMDGFENHPFIFSDLSNYKTRLPNGYPEMMIGGCVSPSPDAV